MNRNKFFILVVKSNEIYLESSIFASSSIKPIEDVVEIHKYKEKNNLIDKNIDFNFFVYKVSHNYSENKIKLLQQSKEYNSEAFLNLTTSDIPLFLNDKKERDVGYYNNENVQYLASDTLFFKDTIPQYFNNKLNDLQKKHLSLFGWIDIEY